MHCTSFIWMLFTEPQQHFTRPPPPPPPPHWLCPPWVCLCHMKLKVKFETRASQVPLVCLHVTRSSVIETLLMHRSFKMDKCSNRIKKERKKKISSVSAYVVNSVCAGSDSLLLKSCKFKWRIKTLRLQICIHVHCVLKSSLHVSRVECKRDWKIWCDAVGLFGSTQSNLSERNLSRLLTRVGSSAELVTSPLTMNWRLFDLFMTIHHLDFFFWFLAGQNVKLTRFQTDCEEYFKGSRGRWQVYGSQWTILWH